MAKAQQTGAKHAITKPKRAPRAASSGRHFSITQLRVRDIRQLASHRYAFASESPASIIMVEALAHHLALLPGDPRKRIAQFLDHEARWYGIERFDDLLEELKETRKWWKAAALGWHLKLTIHEREKLGIVTIEAAGVSPEQRKEMNREKRKQRAAADRLSKGSKPRAEWLAEHSAKPWIAEGISRRTWRRRQCAQVRDH
jgi:hypothetical protein